MSNTTLHQIILKQLILDWQKLNFTLFENQLKQPQIQLINQNQCLGLWDNAQKILKLQEQLVHQQPWLMVLEVLKHEMAHQYVSEYLKIIDDAPHGAIFQKVCMERNIDYHAYTRLEQLTIAQEPTTEKYQLLDKVRKLLALAQSDNVNEAEQATLRAQALIAKHQLDQLQKNDFKNIEFRQLGEPKHKHYLYEYAICKLLSEYFFIDIIWIPNCFNQKTQKTGMVAEILGSYENLEIAEFVYHFLVNNIEILWQKHKKNNVVKNSVVKNNAGKSSLRDMLSFKYGVIKGFESQLEQQKHKHVNEMGLIYLKDPNITEYLQKRYQRIQRKSHSWAPTSSFQDGKTEGEQLKLNHGITTENHDQSSKPPKLLT